MLKILILILIIFHAKEETEINLASVSEGIREGYTVYSNKIEFTEQGTYSITGNSNRALVISNSMTLNLNNTHIITMDELPPIDICSGCQVTFNLKGYSGFEDNDSNTKDAVIYMQSGSSLTITSEISPGGLALYPSKNRGIYGEISTSLIINDGITSQLSNINDAVYIDIGGNIVINHATLIDLRKSQTTNYPSLKAGGSITIKKGFFTLQTIQAGNKIIFSGERVGEGEQKNLMVMIETKNEGIKAKDIEIYSTRVDIKSEKDSLIATGNIKIENSLLFINAGSPELKSSPFKKAGLLQISDSTIVAYGTNCEGGIVNNKGYFSYVGEINPSKQMIITMNGKSAYTLDPDKEYYRYFFMTNEHFPIEFNDQSHMTVDGKIVTSEENSCGANSNNKGNENNNSAKNLNRLKLYYVLLLISLILL